MRPPLTTWQILGRTLAVLCVPLVTAAILFPIFAKARIHDKHYSCLSNMKILGLALTQYEQDNNELMPPVTNIADNTWRVGTYKYYKSYLPYKCPDDVRAPGPDSFFQSYAFNIDSVTDTADAKPQPLATVSSPETLVLLCEVQNSDYASFDIDDALHFPPSQHVLAVRHSGGGNYLFADGHARWLHPLATQGYWYRDSMRPLSSNGLAVLREAQAR